MPSPAALKFKNSCVKAESILAVASDVRLRPLARDKSDVLCHSALASCVSSWQLYVEQIIRDFITVISNHRDAKYRNVHHLVGLHANAKIGKLNTPNAPNTRNIIIESTGYDPWPDWNWNNSGMNVIQIRDRLDEILRVRHSFAHGHQMPGYPWNTTPAGHVRLSSTVVRSQIEFVAKIVKSTDRGMSIYINRLYLINTGW